MNQYSDNSLALHTDKYQLNMVEVYWRQGLHHRRAVFEIFFRKMPFGNGYAVFAGLERVVEYLQNFRFTEEDIEYLRQEGYAEDYLEFLPTPLYRHRSFDAGGGSSASPTKRSCRSTLHWQRHS